MRKKQIHRKEVTYDLAETKADLTMRSAFKLHKAKLNLLKSTKKIQYIFRNLAL